MSVPQLRVRQIPTTDLYSIRDLFKKKRRTSAPCPAQHQNDASQRADAVQSMFHQRNGPLM